jgi:metal-dependent amidase/aminoacylase/carboxypeptidase family protein
VSFSEGAPPLVNAPEMASLARKAADLVVGASNILPLRAANMGAEDFSYYLAHVPGAYVRFGGQVTGREGFPAHSSRFDFDEVALGVGAAYYHAIARFGGRYLCDRAGAREGESA